MSFWWQQETYLLIHKTLSVTKTSMPPHPKHTTKPRTHGDMNFPSQLRKGESPTHLPRLV